MKELSAIAVLGTCLFALPALADSVSIDCDVAVVTGQDGVANAPPGSVMICIADTERLGFSALDSISPDATLAVGGGLLQTSGQTNGYIVSMWPVDYVAGDDAGDAQGSIGPDVIAPGGVYTPGQPTTLHYGDPLYVMWFPSVIDMDAYNGNGLNTSDNWNNPGSLNGLSSWGIEATLGPLGAKAPFGIFGYQQETTDPQPGGGSTYEGDPPGWIIPPGGSTTNEYAATQSAQGNYSGTDPNFTAQYQTIGLPGDANGDGKVDINDLTVVLAHYGQTGTTWSQGEFTGDGTVDINDLTIVLAHYGQSAGSAAGLIAVPEPCTPALLAAGLVCLLACARRRRK